MKRLLLLAISLLLCLSLFACNEEKPDANNDTATREDTGVLDLSTCYTVKLEESEERTLFVQFEMEGGATFVVELYPEYAPATVENFQNLVADGFYDGLTFHRVYKNFMIQGGCPRGDGTGSTDMITGEFAANGFTQNTLKHERGVISMARRTAPNTASCQFFIMHASNANLDGSYAAFGRVVVGMETIDTIAEVKVTLQDISEEKTKPVQPICIRAATFVNYVADTTE